MKLPIPFLKTKKEESDYYLALILTDEKVGAVVLKAEAHVLKKINAHEAFFSESLEELLIDDLIGSVDKAISRAEEVLPPDIQTHQTIFGVKDIWVDPETKKIKKEYLEKLKKVCGALDLTPLGFMVTTEAITHLMQEEEGAPVSAVFAEINKHEIILSLLRGGKIIESVSSPHLESAPVTVDKLLGHFTVPVLPARMVIFQSKPDERTSQAFLSHQWSKSLPFMHVPQITVLPPAFAMRSVMSGAAAQMGFTIDEGAHDVLPAVAPKIVREEEAFAQEELSDSTNATKTIEQPPIDFGQSAEGAQTDAATASDFGFMMDQDIAERESLETPDFKNEEVIPVRHRMHNEEPLVHAEESEDTYEPQRQQTKTSFLASFAALRLPENFALPTVAGLLEKIKGNNKIVKIIIPVVVLIVLFIGTVFFYYYKMQANVLLTMKPTMVSQDETVTFSTAQSDDFGNNIIAAKSISISIAGQATTQATGKKKEGNKAKGTVTIYNNASSPVSLSSGTELTASNGKIFLLDNSVQVASASGDVFSGTKPGTADATVTAQSIGTDGNEPSGTQFTIGSGNTIAAKNDTAFSGGTQQTVTVVSANDIAKLRSDLPKSVQGSAQQKLAAQAASGQTVLPFISSPIPENEKFTHHIGDNASQVSLTADVVYTGMVYDNSDLDSYARTIIKQKYPQDPTIANQSVKEVVSGASLRTKYTATATVSIQAGLLPAINKNDVISNIAHESLRKAENSLTALPQVANATITFSPPIPFLPSLFPSLPRHINVNIASQ